ncbi:MAG TPA: ABC transporter permease [Pseudonocardiaceae bacterium]
MNLREAVFIALRGLRVHRLRSVLTMLGIIVGVAAVIVLVAIGQGMQNSVNARIEPLANLITIVPQIGNVPGGSPPKNLIDADVTALLKAPEVATATPVTTGPTLVETDTVKFRATIVGSTEDWALVNNRDLDSGSFFEATQTRSSARVVVLGPVVASTLFGDPATSLNQTMRINHQTFRVVGVMQSYGQQADKSVIMPLNTARRFIFGGSDDLNQILVQAPGTADVPAAQSQVIDILDSRHQIKDPSQRDFEVQSLGSRLKNFNQILRILTLFTAAVAAISLFVGGIGVLNIMLVSVTERTREIGIRKAIGATRSAILQQFLIESVVLTSLGGIIGILVGVGLSVLGGVIAPKIAPDSGVFASFAPVVSVPSVVISFAISLAIGVIAGGYPANRAARLRPIEALRYD